MFDLPEAGSAGADPAVNAETLEGPAEPVGFAVACPRQDAELTGEDEVAADDDRLARVLDGQAPQWPRRRAFVPARREGAASIVPPRGIG